MRDEPVMQCITFLCSMLSPHPPSSASFLLPPSSAFSFSSLFLPVLKRRRARGLSLMSLRYFLLNS